MSLLEKIAATGLATVAICAALIWIGWGYKGQTCASCGQAAAYWRLDQDGCCETCRAVYERDGYPLGFREGRGDHRDVRGWPVIREVLKSRKVDKAATDGTIHSDS